MCRYSITRRVWDTQKPLRLCSSIPTHAGLRRFAPARLVNGLQEIFEGARCRRGIGACKRVAHIARSFSCRPARSGALTVYGAGPSTPKRRLCGNPYQSQCQLEMRAARFCRDRVDRLGALLPSSSCEIAACRFHRSRLPGRKLSLPVGWLGTSRTRASHRRCNPIFGRHG